MKAEHIWELTGHEVFSHTVPWHDKGFGLGPGRDRSSLLIKSGLVGSTDCWWGATSAEDAQGTPTQSHISPSIYTSKRRLICAGMSHLSLMRRNVGAIGTFR